MAISAKTQTIAIFGHPVGHSLSPAMHNAAFAAKNLDYVYVAHDVHPDQLAAAMSGIRALGYRGLSVTIPHKIAAMALVDTVDEVAQRIGCINTVICEAGCLKGYNSDGLGALGALRAAHSDPQGEEVVLVGTGGAARAIAMTLALEAPPRRISVLGIVPTELQKLVADLSAIGKTVVDGLELTDQNLSARLKSARFLLQTTPVGMAPNVDATPVPAELLHRDLVVFDAVYTPRVTRLLRDAKSAQATTVLGLEMFLGQALVQFRLFTGQEPPVDIMRAVVEERLGR
jgi:shikimate dehydrogenase